MDDPKLFRSLQSIASAAFAFCVALLAAMLYVVVGREEENG